MIKNTELIAWMIEQSKRNNRYLLGGIGRTTLENGKVIRLFDCIGLFKCRMWNDYTQTNSSGYKKNVPDWNETQFFNQATKKGSIETLPEKIGIALWQKGHIGYYLGNGAVIECTAKVFPSGEGKGIVFTQFKDSRSKNYRNTWTHWFELPNIEYEETAIHPTVNHYESIINDIMDGKYGNGNDRKKALEVKGLNYEAIMIQVNLYFDKAREVLSGKYGNIPLRKTLLEKEGFNYELVQKIVNAMIKG